MVLWGLPKARGGSGGAPGEILGAGSEFIFLTIHKSDYIDNNNHR